MHRGSEVAFIVLMLSAFVGLCISIAAVYLVVSQRFSSPISRRVYPLVMMSLGANFFAGLIHVMEGILFFTYHESPSIWTLFYLGLLSEYWVVAPYVCRTQYVRASAHNKRMLRRLGQHLYFRQSLRYMLIVFLPWLIAVIVIGCCSVSHAFPYSFNEQDSEGKLLRHALWLPVCFILCMTWLFSIYQLRFITTKFNIALELSLVCAIFCLSELIQLPVYYYDWVFFNIVLRNILIVCVTGIWPALRLKQAKSQTLVTPEVTSCFELAMLQKDLLKGFLHFLQSTDDEKRNEENLLWLVLALNELDMSPTYEDAKMIFDDYISSSDLFSEEIKSFTKYSLSAMPDSDILSDVFKDSRKIALRRLKHYHFPLFLNSQFFEIYQKKIEAMNRVVGSFETTTLEMQ